MLQSNILGITGGKRHGKDTTANFIAERIPIVRVSFAEPLKRCAQELFAEQKIDWENKDGEYLPIPGKHTVRDLYIAIGRGLRDYLDPNIWLWLAQNKIACSAKPNSLVVITDVRYPNEAKLIRSLGGKVVKIVRPELLPYSEAEVQIDLISSDYFLLNSGSLEDLRTKIQASLLPEIIKTMTEVGKQV